MNVWYFLPIILRGWATVERSVVASVPLTMKKTSMTGTPVAQIFSVNEYIDVSPSDYYYPALESLLKYGISFSYPDKSFRGNRSVTRYEFISLISFSLDQMKQLGIRLVQPIPVVPPSVGGISDVHPTDWAFQAIQNLVEEYEVNLIYPDGTFRGNRALVAKELIPYLNQMVGANLQLSDLQPYLPTDTEEDTPITRGTYVVILNQALEDTMARDQLLR